MSEPTGTGLQFDRAEWGEGGAGGTCSACQSPIRDTYYQANDRVLCASCRLDFEGATAGGTGPARFVKAVAFGVVAAGLGAVLWYAVEAITGWQIGLIAIAVGFLVGGAVRHGAEHRGGWPYQALAMFLTYASIVSTYVPLILEGSRDHADPTGPALGAGTLVLAFAIAFAAPFLMGFQNIMGIIIIGIGLYEAWKMNRKVPLAITGPFRVASPAPPAVSE